MQVVNMLQNNSTSGGMSKRAKDKRASLQVEIVASPKQHENVLNPRLRSASSPDVIASPTASGATSSQPRTSDVDEEHLDQFDVVAPLPQTFLGLGRRRSSVSSFAGSETYSLPGDVVDLTQRRLSDEALSGFLYSCCSPADVVRLKEILDHAQEERSFSFCC